MKIIVANIVTLLGACLLLFAYYYCEPLYEQYLLRTEAIRNRSTGWARDFQSVFYAIQAPNRWLLPVILSLCSYILICFGIISSLSIIDSDGMASLYSAVVVVTSFAFLFVLLIMEKKRRAKKPVVMARLIAAIIIITGSLIAGGVIGSHNFGSTTIPAIVYFSLACLLMIIPAMHAFRATENNKLK